MRRSQQKRFKKGKENSRLESYEENQANVVSWKDECFKEKRTQVCQILLMGQGTVISKGCYLKPK